jgi:hypothetical protein
MTTDELKNLDSALLKVRAEVIRARRLHPVFTSPHEAYAILQEEVDELWADIKQNRLAPAVAESIQVAAMAVRFISEFTDLTDDE